jgi:hypothetical protein
MTIELPTNASTKIGDRRANGGRPVHSLWTRRRTVVAPATRQSSRRITPMSFPWIRTSS